MLFQKYHKSLGGNGSGVLVLFLTRMQEPCTLEPTLKETNLRNNKTKQTKKLITLSLLKTTEIPSNSRENSLFGQPGLAEGVPAPGREAGTR